MNYNPTWGEEEYRAFVENAPYIITRFDRNLRHLYVNRKIEALTGLDRSTFIGKTNRELGMPSNLADLWESKLKHTFEHGAETIFHFEFLTSDGLHYFEGRFIPELNSAGEVVTALGMAHDITELRVTAVSLSESERFAHSVFNALPSHIAILDENGVIIAVNQAWRDFGTANGAVLEKTCEGVNYLDVCSSAFGTYAEGAAGFVQNVRSIMRGDLNEFLIEYPCHSPETKRWFQARVNRFPGDGPLRVVISHENITERKLAEIAAYEQRELAEALSDTMATLLNTLDMGTVMMSILENVGRVIPHDASNIMLLEGEQVRVAYWRGYPSEFDTLFKDFKFPLSETPNLHKMFITGRPYIVPYTKEDPVWVDVPETEWVMSHVGIPIQAYGQVIGFLCLDSSQPGYFNAIHNERLMAFANQAAIAVEHAQLYQTMQQHMLELEARVMQRTVELHRSKEHVETILNSSSDAIVVTGKEGAIRQCNPAFTVQFGYDSMAIFNKPLQILVDRDSLQAFDSILNEVIASGQPRRAEIVTRRSDSTTFDADMMLSPVHNDGEMWGVVCSVRDVTERKLQERELRNALEREKELGELKSRFASMVSHEFRTPLAIILSSSDLLQNYDARLTPEKKQEHYERIRSSIYHLTSLTDDISTIAKAESGRLTLNLTPINLHQLCETILENLRDSVGENHKFSFNREPGTESLQADEKLIRQILNNLLTNAVKYSPPNSNIDLKLHLDHDTVIISVKDEGIGVPLKDQLRIFEPFHRSDNVKQVSGTGLGLFITRQAVEMHGGTIRVESVAGQGATFIVRLPIHHNRMFAE